MIRFASVLSLLLLMPSIALSQASDSSAGDSLFREAQRLVAGGQGDSGRAIVQQQVDAAAPGSPAYVDALYWRAVVAATAADAEHDLRMIVVTYPASRRSGDALLRLAQLEMARGENDQALQHLHRIVVEHPDSPDRGRAEFWTARVLVNRGDLRVGCARLADASRLTPPAQVELQNQIGYLQQRCAGVDTSAAAATPPPRRRMRQRRPVRRARVRSRTRARRRAMGHTRSRWPRTPPKPPPSDCGPRLPSAATTRASLDRPSRSVCGWADTRRGPLPTRRRSGCARRN